MSSNTPGPSDQALRPRDLGQLLDQSFKVFGRSWKSLVTVGLIAAIPGVLWGMFSFLLIPVDPATAEENWLVRIILSADAGDFSGIFALMGGFLFFIIALLLLMPLYSGALIDVTARAVLFMEPVSVGESIRIAARHYGRLLGTAILMGLAYILAVPVLILGGLLIFAVLTVPFGLVALGTGMMFANHAIVIENRNGGFGAIGRSWELVRFRFWPLLGYSLVFYIMVWTVQGMITFPVSMGAGIIAALSESVTAMGPLYIVQGLVQAVAVPFLAVGRTLMYFDTRIRREGYDLEVMARQQGQSASASSPANPLS